MGRRRLTGLDLPERVYFDHGAYWHHPKGARKVRLCSHREEIDDALRRYVAAPTRMDVRHLTTVLAHARKNAKSRGLPFDCSREQMAALWLRSHGRCELTGLAFDLLNLQGFRRRPFAPSLDRIDSRRGYIDGNCRLILAVLNLALNEFGEEIFAKVAVGFLRSRASRARNIKLAEKHSADQPITEMLTR